MTPILYCYCYNYSSIIVSSFPLTTQREKALKCEIILPEAKSGDTTSLFQRRTGVKKLSVGNFFKQINRKHRRSMWRMKREVFPLCLLSPHTMIPALHLVVLGSGPNRALIMLSRALPCCCLRVESPLLSATPSLYSTHAAKNVPFTGSLGIHRSVNIDRHVGHRRQTSGSLYPSEGITAGQGEKIVIKGHVDGHLHRGQ